MASERASINHIVLFPGAGGGTYAGHRGFSSTVLLLLANGTLAVSSKTWRETCIVL